MFKQTNGNLRSFCFWEYVITQIRFQQQDILDDQPLHTFLLDTLMKTVVANNSDEFLEHQVIKQKEQQYIGHNKDAKVDQASQLTETGNDCEGSDLKIVQDIIEELSKEHHLQRQSTAPIKKCSHFSFIKL